MSCLHEMEPRIFVCEGSESDRRDRRDILNTGQRLESIANNQAWMYFEMYSTIKPCAHKLAYRRVAETYQEQSNKLTVDEVKLLTAIVEALDYKDWENGGQPNLWTLIAELGCLTPKNRMLTGSSDDKDSVHHVVSNPTMATSRI